VTRVHTKLTGRGVAAVVAVSALLCTTGCGDQVLQGRGSSYLVVSMLEGFSGAKPGESSTILQSDVVTIVKQQTADGTVYVPTVFEDMGKVSLRISMKDPTSLTGPSATNAVTVNRYHVDFVRSDGRNTQGVDVPYSFDGAMTGTIGAGDTITLAFALVRVQAKLEAPLLALRNAGGAMVVSTIAQVTFYGQDQAGNAVSVTGNISVNFADWGDPS
jgi:hypothetical protein